MRMLTHTYIHPPPCQSTHTKLHNPAHWKARKEGEVMVVVEKIKVGSGGRDRGGGGGGRGGQGEKGMRWRGDAFKTLDYYKR